jgi:PKD repeat protein
MSKSTGILILASVLATACTVKETTPPPLAGPSELALRLALQVVPDSIMQDGASQAVLSVDATNGDGRAARGLAMRVEIVADGVVQDYGTLSAKTIVTGEDGRARVTYTAPPRPSSMSDPSRVISLRVIPIGNDFQGELPRQVSLQLVTPGVILPPNNAPTARFTFTPTTPAVLQDVVFDASTSSDGIDANGDPIGCGASCTYEWDFGDGATARGVFVTHRYQRVGLYLVKLTATDAGGASAVITQALQVGQGVAPTAVFTYSPTSPAVSQDIFFNASGSTAVTGRRIVAYDWDFGSGRTGSGVTVTKRYDTAGTYVVTLTVTDDSGSQGITRQNVTVGQAGTGPQAIMTVSPTTGTTATTFNFDGRSSTGPSPITQYSFSFGDGTPEVTNTTGTAQHQYSTPGTYVVRLTVRDSIGRTGVLNTNVQVAAPTP